MANPKQHSIGGNYLVCLGQSPEHGSKWKDVLVALLFRTEQRKCYGNAAIYKDLITQFHKLLEDGVEVNGTVVRPVLMLCHGDNKSINEYTGLVAYLLILIRSFCYTIKLLQFLIDVQQVFLL